MDRLKQVVKHIPIVGKAVRFVFGKLNRNNRFPGSAAYWERRYLEGGTSGSGSYNNLADFKASFVNEFLNRESISSTVEYGCGDGNQLQLMRYRNYIGVDVSATSVKRCQELFAQDRSKEFYELNSPAFKQKVENRKFDLSLSLDVIFHLTEDVVFERYMEMLFHSSSKFVIIYSSNFESGQTYHERDRKFTNWVELFQPEWELMEHVPNRYPYDKDNPDHTSKADFYVYKMKD